MNKLRGKINSLAAIMIVLVFAIAVFGGVYYYKYSQLKGTEKIAKQQMPLVKAPEITITPTSTIDISDWQIYRNEKYGFEISYPTVGWEFQGLEEKNPVFWINKPLNGTRNGNESYYIAGRIEFIDAQCYGISWGREIQPEIFQCIIDKSFNFEIEKEIATDYKVKGLKGKGGGTTFGRIVGVVFPILKEIGDFYPILLISYDSDINYTQEELKIFDRVVSSFRFLD